MARGPAAEMRAVRRIPRAALLGYLWKMALEFEWDPTKAEANLTKHGVPFDEAVTAFADPHGRVVADPRHSVGELRFAILGLSNAGRLLAVMFTERGERIRLISARKATRRERADYEENPS